MADPDHGSAGESGPRSFLKSLGPGLITGAADDDPSGIGTHSQIGAEFGYGLAWTVVLSFPLMVVIQEIAADALRPIAGQFAFAMFAVGIIGAGLLAVPMLAGSAAYAVTEMAGLPGSFDAQPFQARMFYATIATTTLAGGPLNYVGIDPARALNWAAVVNGILAAPLMAVMMLTSAIRVPGADLPFPSVQWYSVGSPPS